MNGDTCIALSTVDVSSVEPSGAPAQHVGMALAPGRVRDLGEDRLHLIARSADRQ